MKFDDSALHRLLTVLRKEGFRIAKKGDHTFINGRPIQMDSLHAHPGESTLTPSGHLKLGLDDGTWLNISISDSKNDIKATDLISPYALQILQALLQNSDIPSSSFETASRFAREYNLSQSRLSRMMNLFDASTIPDLSEKIRRLPFSIWENAMKSALTRRKLTSFRSIQRSYFSSPLALKILSHSDAKEKFRTWAPSALTVLSEETGYQNSVRSYWMTDHFFQEFRASSKLIPARETDGDRIEIGICKEGDFFSHAIVDDRRQNLNLIRAAWDAFAYGEREREAAKDLLRKIMSPYENRF